jgi:hypothetical protein
MAFVQIMELHTSRFDDIVALEAEWRAATEGTRTLRRSVLTRDRNDPNRYLVFAFFDSYESAMANSNLPATTEFGEKQAKVLDAPATFTDLDIIEEKF